MTSRHTCEWGMIHTWMRHATHGNGSCHTRGTCELGSSLMWIICMCDMNNSHVELFSHITHVNLNYSHTSHMSIWMIHCSHVWRVWHDPVTLVTHVILNSWHVTHVNLNSCEGRICHMCDVCDTVIAAHRNTDHVTHVTHSHVLFVRKGVFVYMAGVRWVISHIRMSHITHVNGSCHTRE